VFLSVRAEPLDEQTFKFLGLIQAAAERVVSTKIALDRGRDLLAMDGEDFGHRLFDLIHDFLADGAD
jgi:hypothetical protein